MTKIREFSTRWDRPEDRTWYERDKEALIGSAKGSKRDTPKFRPFDMIGEPNQSLILWRNEPSPAAIAYRFEADEVVKEELQLDRFAPIEKSGT